MKNRGKVVFPGSFFIIASLFAIPNKVKTGYPSFLIQICKGIQDTLHAFGIFQPSDKTKTKRRFKFFLPNHHCSYFPIGLRQTRIFETQAMFGLRSEERRVGKE